MEPNKSQWASRFIGATFVLGAIAWLIIAALVLGNVLAGMGRLSSGGGAIDHGRRRRRSERRLCAHEHPEPDRGPNRGAHGNCAARISSGRDWPRDRVDGRPKGLIPLRLRANAADWEQTR